MKKLVLTLLAFISATISIAQSSGNTLRVYSDNSSYNHSVKAAEIDSITYDYDYQLQKVYANGNLLSFPISEVDSVVFQEKLNYTIVNEIVENMDGILAEDGKALLYGEDSGGNNVMQYGEFDFVTKTWKEESMFVIQVNDDGMPISFITKDIAYGISYNSDGSFDVLSFNENGTYDVIATKLSIPNKSRAYGVRRGPSFGDVGGWVGNGLTAWNLINEIKAGGVALSTGLNALGALVGLGNSTGGFLIGGTGDILAWLKSGASGLYGGALTLATYLAQKSREFQLSHLGDWKISVISAQQKTRTQCEVTYSITGINIDPEGNPRHRLLLKNSQNKYTTYDLGVAENGVFTKLIDISSPGEYSVEMSLYDECHKFIRQLTYPATKFYIADLGIEKVEVRDYNYADEMVTYDLNIFLNGDKESLNDAKEYGYYITYGDSYDYQFTKVTLSTIFSSTESTKELAIGKNLFEMDYSNFKAECSDYKIGAYVILKDGTPIYFDEQKIDGLVYDKKPSLTFTNVQVGSPSAYPYYDDDGSYLFTYYSTPLQFDFNVEGAFWMNYVQSFVYGGSWEDNEGPIEIVNDGAYSNPSSMGYDDLDGWFTYSYHIYLNNGSSLSSTNSVVFGGTPSAPTATIGGAPSHARSNKAPSANQKAKGNTTMPITTSLFCPRK